MAAPITKGIERSSPHKGCQRLADAGDAQERREQQHGLDVRGERKPSIVNALITMSAMRTIRPMNALRPCTKTPRDLERDDKDRLEHQERNQIGDRAEWRRGGRDNEIGEQQQRHGDDQRAVADPYRAYPDERLAPVRLDSLGGSGLPVLEGDGHVVCEPKQDRDRHNGEEQHRLRRLPLRKADAEPDRADDQGNRQVQNHQERGARQQNESSRRGSLRRAGWL